MKRLSPALLDQLGNPFRKLAPCRLHCRRIVGVQKPRRTATSQRFIERFLGGALPQNGFVRAGHVNAAVPVGRRRCATASNRHCVYAPPLAARTRSQRELEAFCAFNETTDIGAGTSVRILRSIRSTPASRSLISVDSAMRVRTWSGPHSSYAACNSSRLST
ncbi:hypothetical protein [Mycobacterium sp.]|uniref:hypothetical protein n=1 Tax=Mycobacterium sp. TaxID=1785 RepID=UPI003C7106B8